jgi:parvulin-like peptidyl-prolyl isomerase
MDVRRLLLSAACAGALCLAAPATPSMAEVVDRIAATVDEVAIPETEVRKAMVISAVEALPGETPEAHRKRVIDALIDERLQYREALRFGPATPEPSAIDAAVKRLRERLVAEGKNPDQEFARAGMTPEEVRAALERQIVVQNYLQERFRPISFADEERAREEYAKFYLPERKAAGAAPQPFESVVEDMRRNSQQRLFNEEAEKWMKEIRQKARITIYPAPVPIPADRKPVPLSAKPPK